MRITTLLTTSAILLTLPTNVEANVDFPLFPDFQTGKNAHQQQDYTTAARHYMPLAHKGNPRAQNELGKLYVRGQGVKQNSTTAMNLFKAAAEQNYAPAMAEIGKLYEKGDGVPQNFDIAKSWYEKASANGYTKSNYNIGQLYEKNRIGPVSEVPVLDKKTRDDIRNATKMVKEGNYKYANFLGDTYSSNPKIQSDYRKALTYYMISYANGDDSARDKVTSTSLKTDRETFTLAKADAKTIITPINYDALPKGDKIAREQAKEELKENKRSSLSNVKGFKPTVASEATKDLQKELAVNSYKVAAEDGYGRAHEKIVELDPNLPGYTPPLFNKGPAPKYRILSEIQTQFVGQENIDLSTRDEETETSFITIAKVKAEFYPTENITAYVEGRAQKNFGLVSPTVDDGNDSSDDNFIDLRQAYLKFDNLAGHSPISASVGRQRFSEDRAILWNRNLDAVRLSMDTTLTKGFVAVGQNLTKYRIGDDSNLDEDEKDRFRVLAEVSHEYAKDNLIEGRMLYEDDHSSSGAVGGIVSSDDIDDEDANLLWAGLRLTGEKPSSIAAANSIIYRADLIGVVGDETLVDTNAGPGANQRTIDSVTDRDVFGVGFDGEVAVKLEDYGQPIISVGYAYGSGDKNSDDLGNTDTAFRQTDLHANSSRFVHDYSVGYERNYGEVLRPELSNLHILNTGVLIPATPNTEVTFNYFNYWLDEENVTDLRSSGITARLNGNDSHIGQALDMQANVNLTDRLEDTLPKQLEDITFRFILGGFKSGDAYDAPDDEYAFRSTAELRAKF